MATLKLLNSFSAVRMNSDTRVIHREYVVMLGVRSLSILRAVNYRITGAINAPIIVTAAKAATTTERTKAIGTNSTPNTPVAAGRAPAINVPTAM